jgi:hypothetical protein
MKNSVTMTVPRKQQMMGLIEDYVDHYCTFIPSLKLLDQFKVFGDKHKDDDLAIAFGWALVMMQADKKAVQLQDQLLDNLPKTRLERTTSGRLQLVAPKSNIQRQIPRTLFKR